MKLPDRENIYKWFTPSQLGSDFMNPPKIKLIYRGHIYYTTPRPVVALKAVKTDQPAVTLIYRGNIYEYKPQAPKLYQKPRAINWRYQMGYQFA